MAAGAPGVSSRPVVNPVEVGCRSDSGHVTTHPHPMMGCPVLAIPCRQPLVIVNNVQVLFELKKKVHKSMQENDLKIDIFRYWFMFSDIDCAFKNCYGRIK